MVQRSDRAPTQTAGTREAEPAIASDDHSGEGSASALEILQKLERRRVAATPGDPPPGEPVAP